MREEERKFDVGRTFAVPDLSEYAASTRSIAPQTLHATYFDTDDLRLVRSGASMRFRTGETAQGGLWTVKLPTSVPGVREEIEQPGTSGAMPSHLIWLVTSLSRGAPLVEVAQLQTRRLRTQLRGTNGRLLAELADDTVTAQSGAARQQFREIEVERKAGSRRLLDRVGRELLAAGAQPAASASKLARVLGERATAAPDLVPPAPALPPDATGAELVTQAVRRGAARVLSHDPLLRLRQPLPGGDTAVHQLRVGCRRLRSDLRTFAAQLDQPWQARLRMALGWLAGQLAAARDCEVLRARLARTAHGITDPGVNRLDALLSRQQERAMATLDDALRSARYLDLVELLTAATRQPQLAPPAAAETIRLPGKPQRQLASAVARLSSQSPDADWHQVRILTKRARYAAEAAGLRAEALAGLQDLLGEFQDAVVAAQTWRRLGDVDPQLGFLAGRLYERERAAAAMVKEQFPDAWQRCS